MLSHFIKEFFYTESELQEGLWRTKSKPQETLISKYSMPYDKIYQILIYFLLLLVA